VLNLLIRIQRNASITNLAKWELHIDICVNYASNPNDHHPLNRIKRARDPGADGATAAE